MNTILYFFPLIVIFVLYVLSISGILFHISIEIIDKISKDKKLHKPTNTFSLNLYKNHLSSILLNNNKKSLESIFNNIRKINFNTIHQLKEIIKDIQIDSKLVYLLKDNTSFLANKYTELKMFYLPVDQVIEDLKDVLNEKEIEDTVVIEPIVHLFNLPIMNKIFIKNVKTKNYFIKPDHNSHISYFLIELNIK